MFPNMPEVSQMIFFYVLEACLVNLELPKKLFICSDVLARPVTRILCGGGGANEAKVDQTTEINFLLSIRL